VQTLPEQSAYSYLALLLGVGFAGALGFMMYRVTSGRIPALESKTREADSETTTVTFADVAGVDEAKEEVKELVDFLREPSRFVAIGGRIPKGVLLVGPPGTGKTLLARSITAGQGAVPRERLDRGDVCRRRRSRIRAVQGRAPSSSASSSSTSRRRRAASNCSPRGAGATLIQLWSRWTASRPPRIVVVAATNRRIFELALPGPAASTARSRSARRTKGRERFSASTQGRRRGRSRSPAGRAERPPPVPSREP
jgi:hypothetical protein